MSDFAINEEAIKRNQELLRQLNLRRLQEQLLKAIAGGDALEDTTSLSYFMDQLSLNEVSKAEKRYLSQTGENFQGSEVYGSLTSLPTHFNTPSA